MAFYIKSSDGLDTDLVYYAFQNLPSSWGLKEDARVFGSADHAQDCLDTESTESGGKLHGRSSLSVVEE